ncbi:acyl-CoA dehydrogenase family protein [Paenibacillus eucommiae]|uniref:Alkylation response protein AidB-like acyl-CoA dehydrogenase n=1 Tax=Paenibacillus eucommiae TaxID=1355755 RepID=A0ABS4IXL7_9BACL|nr:acyl-CoA dehydrogenase family protein [Paenibacillus eucommiae]MBP1991631.1 alkylation response protein AidB-like acyl-CoA dehydrogenase [Paenibacillus eucommiae]
MPSAQNKFVTTQHKWLTRLDEVLERNAAETIQADETNGFNYSLISDLKAIGYPQLAVPNDLGGEGLSLTDFLLYQERIAKTDAPVALAIGWHINTVLQLSKTRHWKESGFSDLCKAVLERGALVNRADSEAATGSPSRGGKPQTTAIKTENGYRLTGRKSFTSLAPVLDYFIVSVFDQDGDCISDFLVPRETEGLSIEPTWNMVGMRGTGSHDLVLQEAYVPAAAKVNRQHKSGQENANQSYPHNLCIPAVYLGIALAAREEAIRFANSYQPNSLTHPIAQVPHIQQSIGRMELELSTARHFMYSVTGRYENQLEATDEDFIAVKVYAIQTALSVVDTAMRIVGAHSLAMSHPLQRMYRDVRFGLHNPPMEDYALRQLAISAIEDIQGK